MNDVVLEKLNNLKNCLDRIEKKKPFTIDQLKADFDLQDTITVNIQRAIQSSVDLAAHICSQKNLRTPNDMADSFVVLSENKIIEEVLALQLRKAVGLRNVLVHDYSGIDWSIVYNVAYNKMDFFKKYIEYILKV
jgi:uncharacterized protein YutE (UPF0331/DUF86 family)